MIDSEASDSSTLEFVRYTDFVLIVIVVIIWLVAKYVTLLRVIFH